MSEHVHPIAENMPPRRNIKDAAISTRAAAGNIATVDYIIDTHQESFSKEQIENARVAVQAFPNVDAPTPPAATAAVVFAHSPNSDGSGETQFASGTLAAPTAGNPSPGIETPFPILPDGERYLKVSVTTTDDWSPYDLDVGVAV